MSLSHDSPAEQEQRYVDLCARIRTHCARQGWYGPDGDAHDKGQNSRLVSHVQYPRDPTTGFGYPPATDYQLYLTQTALGYPLPPLLRFLLRTVANGGFGPSYGITGAYGGYCPGYDGHYSTLEGYATQIIDDRRAQGGDTPLRYISLADITARYVTLPPDVWPKQFLPLTYDGCAEDTYLDVETGRVYHAGAGDQVGPQQWETILIRESDSLEDWLEDWLRGIHSISLPDNTRYRGMQHVDDWDDWDDEWPFCRANPIAEWDADGPIYWVDFSATTNGE